MATQANLIDDSKSVGKRRIYWRYIADAEPAFRHQFFDSQWLTQNNFVVQSPSAGRGGALFLHLENQDLVLRPYMRGGLARTISEDQYIWTGLNSTRAVREFNVLCDLQKLGLPAPRPYAYQVTREGVFYRAALITFYLMGTTLAEYIGHTVLSEEQWARIGACIARFHHCGVNHADLNAHNILLDANDEVSLIDFDRASIRARSVKNVESGNLKRLRRSLDKIGSSGPVHFDEKGWQALKGGYVRETT